VEVSGCSLLCPETEEGCWRGTPGAGSRCRGGCPRAAWSVGRRCGSSWRWVAVPGAAARARPGALVAAEGCAASGEGTSAAPGGTPETRHRGVAAAQGRRPWERRTRTDGSGGPGEGGAPGRWEGGRRPEVGGRGVGGWVEAGRLERLREKKKPKPSSVIPCWNENPYPKQGWE
jgi:hypothetical protein